MKRLLGVAALLASTGMLLGAADGSWLHRVSPRDHVRPNPLVRNAEDRENAAAAGKQLFHNECAKCHADDGGGLHNRPPVISDRIDRATDGDLFWLMTNGVPWHGMPPWVMLPENQRWQLVTYLRAINIAENSTAVATTAAEQTTGAKQ